MFLKTILIVLFALAPLSAGEVSMQENFAYAGWPNCIRISNGRIELIATTDIGPRIIRFGFVGGQNIFKEYPEQLGKTGGDEFRVYGGHRLWEAPEDTKRTYAPDNDAVSHSWNGQTLTLTQKPDAAGIQKSMEITMEASSDRVTVVHRIKNVTSSPLELAPWALSSVAPGGRAIFPQEPYRSHENYLLPVRSLALWGYTNMQDPRWTWGTRYIQLRQDPAIKTAQKIGMSNSPGWAAYALGGDVFIKRFAFDPNAHYPDLASNFESYTDEGMLEMESLGPLTQLAPGKSVAHTENWYLYRAQIGKEEADIDANLLPLVQRSAAVSADPH